ncbi:MAG: single-stranded DNA-binding protein [Rikenellaceae bacterium]
MINKVILVGNVGADPEVRTLDNGTKVARVRLATTERFYNSQTKESSDHTEWHTVTLWRGLADVADRFLRKGSQVYIEGRLRSREWTDKDGNRRFGIEILGDELKMLGRRSDSPSSSDQQQGYTNPSPQSSSAQYNQTPTPPEVVAAPQETESDDLPF